MLGFGREAAEPLAPGHTFWSAGMVITYSLLRQLFQPKSFQHRAVTSRIIPRYPSSTLLLTLLVRRSQVRVIRVTSRRLYLHRHPNFTPLTVLGPYVRRRQVWTWATVHVAGNHHIPTHTVPPKKNDKKKGFPRIKSPYIDPN